MNKDKKELEEEIEIKEQVEAVEEAVEEISELDALKEENLKLKNEFLRAYADAENTKKRCQQEIEKNTKYAIASFAKDLLSVADNLDRAISAVPEEKKEDHKDFLKGVELTQEDLKKVFAKFGVKKMDALGQHFDPNFHQVIQEVEDPSKEPGTILQELQTGYMINDRILREAMVIVSKK